MIHEQAARLEERMEPVPVRDWRMLTRKRRVRRRVTVPREPRPPVPIRVRAVRVWREALRARGQPSALRRNCRSAMMSDFRERIEDNARRRRALFLRPRALRETGDKRARASNPRCFRTRRGKRGCFRRSRATKPAPPRKKGREAWCRREQRTAHREFTIQSVTERFPSWGGCVNADASVSPK